MCQSCHTGTALQNNGAFRYDSVFTADGLTRVAVDATFATSPDAPAAGLSLYQFSVGHGGLSCAACHGSPHAEFPSTQRNDNIQSIQHQGHVGMLVECTTPPHRSRLRAGRMGCIPSAPCGWSVTPTLPTRAARAPAAPAMVSTIVGRCCRVRRGSARSTPTLAASTSGVDSRSGVTRVTRAQGVEEPIRITPRS